MKISSRELARIMDLDCLPRSVRISTALAGSASRGMGYSVSALKGEIAQILGLDGHKKMILLGAGNLGKAIVGSLDFEGSGFDLLAIFDTNEWIIGSEIREYPVLSLDKLEDFCHEHHPPCTVHPPGGGRAAGAAAGGAGDPLLPELLPLRH